MGLAARGSSSGVSKPPLAMAEVVRDAVKGLFTKNTFEVLEPDPQVPLCLRPA